MNERTRTYPDCCTSAYCGAAECDGCPNLPTLEAFKAWRERTQAVVRDPIWSPLSYIAKVAICSYCDREIHPDSHDKTDPSLCWGCGQERDGYNAACAFDLCNPDKPDAWHRGYRMAFD
jgi:hypothetical protein